MVTEESRASLSHEGITVLEARDLRKTYPPDVVALDGFSLSLRAGQIHGLAGANGAGKSTAIKILTGVERPSSGTIKMEGLGPVTLATPTEAARCGIGVVHQELPLLPNLTAAENMVLGIDGRGSLRGAARRPALELYEQEAEQFPGAPPGGTRLEHVSLYSWQTVAIVRALHSGARALILDEPTSSLSVEDRAALHESLRALAARSGVAILYVSHFLDDVLDVCDVVTVIRDGRMVAHRPSSEFDEGSLLRDMLGIEGEREVTTPDHAGPGKAAAAAGQGVCLRLDSVTLAGVGPIDLEIGAGERVGLYGLEGSGAHALLEALFALRTHDGEVHWRGRRLKNSTRARIDAGMGLVTGDRKRALIGEWTVEMNHALPWLSTSGPFRLLKSSRYRTETDVTIERLGVKGSSGQPIGALSGGNQQKVALGRWLGRKHLCLMADEPTHGVDAAGRVAIHDLLRGLSADGNVVLVHSTDPEELVALCNRVLVLVEGKATTELDAEALTVDALEAASRLKRPTQMLSAGGAR